MKAKERARNADEKYERVKNSIIKNIQRSISWYKSELKYRKDLDKVVLAYAYNKTTGNNEVVNITNSDYILEQIRRLEEKLADTDTIDHEARRAMYSFVKELPFKDNAGYPIQHYHGDSRIRVPSLKRKTAWKRFYKMYPELKGKDYITGYSTGGAKRASFIKLKQI